MWVPSKSALERESWGWNKGDEKNREAMGPGREVRRGDGCAKRHSKRDVGDWRTKGSDVGRDLGARGRK